MDLAILWALLGTSKFFRSVNLNHLQREEVLAQMGLERKSAGVFVLNYSDVADQFYIILEGKVSVWVPVKPKSMLHPLKKLQKKVEAAITSQLDIATKLSGFSFKFHLDPYLIDTESH